MARGSNPVTMAQDLSQMGQQAKEEIGGAVEQFIDGNQSGGVLGQLDQAEYVTGPVK
ncbi:MAG: hypothetical protein WBL67_08030 [Nitrososphaeraceae archaeon]